MDKPLVEHNRHETALKGDNPFFYCLSDFVRFLEHYILNGPDPNALDAVLAQLNDPKRQSPQELDRAVAGKTT